MAAHSDSEDRTAVLPAGAGAGLRRRLVGLAALPPAAGAAAVLVACLSYRPGDPSLNHAAEGPAANLLGLPGAYVADLLLQGLGAAAFLLPLLLAGWSWRLLSARALPRWWLRLALAPAALVAAAAALAALPTPAGWTPAAGLGGAAGTLALAEAAARIAAPVWMPAAGAGALAVLLAAYASGLARRDWAALGRGAAWLVGAPPRGLLALWRRRRAGEDDEPAAAVLAAAGRAARRREPHLGRDGGEAPAGEAVASAPRIEPRVRQARPGRKGRQADQGRLDLDLGEAYEAPPLALLKRPTESEKGGVSRESLEQNARYLEAVLQDFGVRGEIVKVRPGPVVTRYELEPAPGTKTSRVIGLADDIARSMSAVSVRVAVVPGSSVIGIELPNARREHVYQRELLAAEAYERSGAKLPLILGKDISGSPVILDLARMPHLLIAGTTGSGKSVSINAMLLSLLYRLGPERCRLILIDPKMLELSVYEGIPHLLAPVVTDAKKAVVALKWTVREMEERYRAMSRLGVRNIEGYNARIEEARRTGEVLTRKVQTGFDPDTGQPVTEEQPFDLEALPYVVVVVDEMADLMLVAGKEIEMAVQRLAQMARAAGIHLIMATQRPSVDVITGTIKANFPTRISFHVTSKIDSRTILGETGAEQLLGQGDMLYMAHGGRITRVHGPLVTDGEVEAVVDHLKAQGEPAYVEAVTEEDDEAAGLEGLLPGGGDGGDDLYGQAVQVVCQHRKASTSFVQRQLQIGYNRAARLIERMEAEGVVGSANHVGKREILINSPEDVA